MSYRIHRVMGYGMPWHQFESLCTLDCEAQDTHEELYRKMQNLTEADLTMSKEFRNQLWNTKHVSSPIECNLLKFTLNNEFPNTERNGSCLWELIHNPDETTDVCFFPSAIYAKKWRHYDSYLDYAFEQWRDVEKPSKHDEGCSPRNFTKYLPFGHYPFANDIMLEDGTPEPWEYFFHLRKRDDWVPAPPSEIRWYLTTHGIMDNAGLNKLRPLIAQYWS